MPLKIEIILTDEGRVMFAGPIDNKVMCYGLLEAARDIIQGHKVSESRVQLAPSVQLPPLGGK